MSEMQRAFERVQETMSASPAKVREWAAQALEGTIVEPDRTTFPQAMIECTTEYDYAELPDFLRVGLEQWCDVFRHWDREQRS